MEQKLFYLCNFSTEQVTDTRHEHNKAEITAGNRRCGVFQLSHIVRDEAHERDMCLSGPRTVQCLQSAFFSLVAKSKCTRCALPLWACHMWLNNNPPEGDVFHTSLTVSIRPVPLVCSSRRGDALPSSGGPFLLFCWMAAPSLLFFSLICLKWEEVSREETGPLQSGWADD